MSANHPAVDVNLLVYNARDTIGAAIESVLAQSWPNLTLTIIDNASTDGTLDVAARYIAQRPDIVLHRARANAGGMVNCQRAFTLGAADYVLPKTADDLIAPDYVARVMAVLLEHPDCAMCHAGGLVFTGDGTVRGAYPEMHSLYAVGGNARARAAHVMARYTSAPSFWGVYRRVAIDRLARFRYGAGWDHVVLADVALQGEIRHVPEPLYWRRDGGKPVDRIARESTETAQRGLDADDALAELSWLTPLISTAYAHVALFAVARCEVAERAAMMDDAVRIFRGRWLPAMRREAESLASALDSLTVIGTGAAAAWQRSRIARLTDAVRTMLPEFTRDLSEATARDPRAALAVR